MAARFVAGLHVGDFERNDFIAEQRHNPADGPDEARAAFAGPVHGLRERRFQNECGSASARISVAARPAVLRSSCIFRLCRRRGFPVRRGSTPCFLAKPATAASGADLAGPRRVLRNRAARAIRPSARTTRRRGVASVRIVGSPRFLSFKRSAYASPRYSSAPASIQSGISSPPISRRRFMTDLAGIWPSLLGAPGGSPAADRSPGPTNWSPGFGHANRQFADAPDTPTRSVTLMAPRASSVLNRLLHFRT